ncbi:MAG: type I DNA topoisomerase, partial [Chloroflexota bacterium]
MAKSKQEIIGYCLKCREKRVMSSTSAEFNRRGSPITRGVCSVCGTRMALTGRTKAHEGLEKPKPKSKPKRGNLVIVESPTKARTIRRILGKDYRVLASYGHVRDLLRSRLSVDIENDFTPEYRVPNEKRKVIKTLKQAVEESELVFLATDLDREGEAIAWHIAQATGLEPERTKRVVFHEVTQDAIRSAFANPSEMNDSLIDSQQARRIVDRLVGYQISPILWEKVRNRITAGRVQTVAVRMVVEREREIEAFVPQEYWTIEVELNRELPADEPNPSFRAKLHRIRGEKPDLTGQDQVDPIVAYLKTAQYQVEDVRLGKRRRNPTPPFITSTLQQTAFGRLGFRARRTMRTAQQLYEGVEINGQSHGLITYMRTDSVYSAPSAVQLARKWVKSNFSDDYLPKKPRFFRAKARLAQEAHEAIRPTMVSRTPDSIKHALSSDQYKLYDLIWRRFVASQMAAAVYSTQ